MNIYPAVDILGGEVVRLYQGDYEQVTSYAADIVGTASGWMDAGAPLVHVVDLDGAKSGRPDTAVWGALGAAGIPFQIGGGIRTAEDVERVIDAGATRAILGTAAVWHPEILAAAVDVVGRDRVVAAIDVKGGRATGAGWIDEGKAMTQVVAASLTAGVNQLLVTAVAQDGTMAGPDIGLVEEARRLAPSASIMSAGGIGTLDHLRRLAATGADGAVVGRALYEASFTYEEACAAARPQS